MGFGQPVGDGRPSLLGEAASVPFDLTDSTLQPTDHLFLPLGR